LFHGLVLFSDYACVATWLHLLVSGEAIAGRAPRQVEERMDKVSPRRNARRSRRQVPRRPQETRRAALLAAPPPEPALDIEALADAPRRLVGEARVQGMLVVGLCAAFSLIGLLMMMQGGARIREARQVEGWLTAPGVIEASDVYAAPGSQGEQWRPHISYSYAVGGRLIHSTRIAMSKPRPEDSRETVLAWLSRYPAGGSVTVHYDPVDITQSVLETATPVSAYVNLLFGCVLALMGPGLLALFRRTPPERKHWAARADPAVP